MEAGSWQRDRGRQPWNQRLPGSGETRFPRGTVYYNFKSKTELFEELLRHGVGLLTASLRSAAEQTEERGGTRVEALDAMIRAGLVFIDRYPAFTQLYVA
ncbi:TetR/AcrR family transcriptional regulator, partial [Streptomyces sp. NPDC003236]